MTGSLKRLAGAAKLLSGQQTHHCPQLATAPGQWQAWPAVLMQWRGSKIGGGIKNARGLAAEKTKHRIAMKDLRKVWMRQREEEEKAFQKRRAEKLSSWLDLIAIRRKERRKAQALEAAKRQKAQKLDAQIKDIKAQKAARWRQAVAVCYGRVNEQRRQSLLEASKDWITEENLEERINFALNNPAKLYEDPTSPPS